MCVACYWVIFNAGITNVCCTYSKTWVSTRAPVTTSGVEWQGMGTFIVENVLVLWRQFDIMTGHYVTYSFITPSIISLSGWQWYETKGHDLFIPKIMFLKCVCVLIYIYDVNNDYLTRRKNEKIPNTLVMFNGIFFPLSLKIWQYYF